MTPRLPTTTAAGLSAIASLAGALWCLRGPASAHATGFALYWCALALVVAAAWPWRGRAGPGAPRTRGEAALLAAVLLAGLAFRAYRLGTAPYGVWFDEAQNGLEALRILAEPDYRPVFVPGLSQLPGLVFHYFAFFVDLLGPRALALRVGSTVVGMLSILAVWALGRELFGRPVGLLAAALLAVSRWHVTFSRFAVANVAVTLFFPLALLFFVRSLRRRSPRDAALCGLALGLGLQSYYAMLAAPAVLALLGALAWLRGDVPGRAPAVLGALTLATTAFAYAPVLQYARTHPGVFGQRMQTTTFVRAESPRAALALLVRPTSRRTEAWAALGVNLRAHALMFHVRGDANGRHNLPGAPMLDPVSGVLFALGLSWCLARPWELRRAALLLPFLAMMAAGVLSLTFEAPQGARTLGATPFVALMGALPLAALARRVGRGRGPRVEWAVAGLPLGLAAAWSASVFDRQLDDPAAWESYSTAETRIAQVVRAEGRAADVYVPETLAGGPTVTFLLGETLRATAFERSRDLPLSGHGRPALVFLNGADEATVAQLRAQYPSARVEPFGAPRRDGGIDHPVLWIARVPSDAIAALHGWAVTIEAPGRPARTTRSAAGEWHWTEDAPPFTARLQATVRVPPDGLPRTFVVDGPPARLRVDGEEVLAAGAASSAPLRLAQGLHDVELEARVERRGQRSSLRWRAGTAAPLPLDPVFDPSVRASGLLGAYHAGAELAGDPVVRRIDPQVSFYFHLLPVPRPFSARWTGAVYAPVSGTYAFGTTAIDESSVLVDGRTVVANREPSTYLEGTVRLDAGWHPLEVRYRAVHDYSQVLLQWVPPGGARAPVPEAYLHPPGPSGRLLPRDAPPPSRPTPSALEVVRPAVPAAGTDVLPGKALVGASSRRLAESASRIAAAPQGRVLLLTPPLLLPAHGAPVALAAPRGGWVDPSDVAVAADGGLYVLDAGGFVAVYDASGRASRVVDLRPLRVYNPRGLAVGGGEILIADTGGGRVLVLDRAGGLLQTIGRPGTGAGELADPADCARDGAGAVVVVDAGNGRLQRFGRAGSIEQWRRPGGRAASAAERAAVDMLGVVWVGGGGAREVWALPPGEGPRRHALPGEIGPDGLAVGDGRLLLTVADPPRLLELRVP